MTDTPEIARIRAALEAYDDASYYAQCDELQDACSTNSIRQVLAHIDAQAAEIERLLASLHKLASTVPASDGGGGLFFEHHGPDGEYLGCEYVDPMAVIQEMEDIARNAIGASRNAKS